MQTDLLCVEAGNWETAVTAVRLCGVRHQTGIALGCGWWAGAGVTWGQETEVLLRCAAAGLVVLFFVRQP